MSFDGKQLRVAILGIYHESNTFIAKPTTLDDFRNSHWLKGDAIAQEYRHAFHEIGGMLEVLEENNIAAVPVMYAEATPGGRVSAATYDTLLGEMMRGLEAVLPIDGCLVVPHGAGVSEEHADMDGHWLTLLRQRLGPDMPIIGTLDPHANVSPAMTAATNALVAYSTNPHIDQRDTGKKAATLMVQTLKGNIQPVQQLMQTPVAISIEQQWTSAEPCKGLYDRAREAAGQPGVLSISILLGFPYADVPEMGSAFIVATDNNLPLCNSIGEELKSKLIDRRTDFVAEKHDIAALLPKMQEWAKPVLLLDMGDNVGGGSPGNSAYLLAAAEAYRMSGCFICIYDPTAVAEAVKHPPGETFSLSFGNVEGGYMQGETEYAIPVRLLMEADGKFSEDSPRHGGQVHFDMGKIAVVQTGGGNVIMLTSLRVPPFSLRQLTAFGIHPQQFNAVVAKGVNAPIAAYGPVCPTIVQVNTPGVTQADMTRFTYRHRRQPLFPFEQDIK
ncbi:M81 family metallopeptidase [Chitinophaga sp.]|uniref:M81 family metallopeptidase n=1 Tax=Chitinophaga sp. TaxID=1869181 RepID=UPI00261CD789|nr:M81 family metallopeptidase [uncultured Chitinophaga sp.]